MNTRFVFEVATISAVLSDPPTMTRRVDAPTMGATELRIMVTRIIVIKAYLVIICNYSRLQQINLALNSLSAWHKSWNYGFLNVITQ